MADTTDLKSVDRNIIWVRVPERALSIGEVMPQIPEFMQLLEKMKEIHEKKNNDYAATPFENFERSAEISSWFKYDNDKAFVILIATKLARLATLLNKDIIPNNEPIEDSFLDLTTYCALWAAFYQYQYGPGQNN